MARPHETPAKNSRKRKPLEASSGLFETRALEPLRELEPEPEVPDEVQDSPIPSQGDSVPNSADGESSQAPSEALSVAAPQNTNVLMSSFLEKMNGLGGDIDNPLKA